MPNPNGIKEFFKRAGITCVEDLSKIDDIEARHVLDMIIMYSGLNEMRVHEVQQSLDNVPFSTDQRHSYGSWPGCTPED